MRGASGTYGLLLVVAVQAVEIPLSSASLKRDPLWPLGLLINRCLPPLVNASSCRPKVTLWSRYIIDTADIAYTTARPIVSVNWYR